LVGPVSEAVHDGKHDLICVVMFGLVYRSKFSNFAEPWPFGMVGSVSEAVHDNKQDTICIAMFGLVYRSKFSHFAKYWPF
jgi:hypothetical protein